MTVDALVAADELVGVRRRAFTLLEVVVALSLGVVIIGAAVVVLDQMLLAGHRQHLLSELQRDGAFASQLMQQEIRLAGLGVPTGQQVQQDAGGFIYGSTGALPNTTALVFDAHRILVAGTSSIGFIGDLPRPDSNYNVFGPLHDRVNGQIDAISWHTENNGSCVPCTAVNAANGCPAAPGCNTGAGASAASFFFSSVGSDCTAGALSITCPWASRRIAPGERLQIVDGAGNWSVDQTAASLAPIASNNGILSLKLAFPLDNGTVNQWNNGCTSGVYPCASSASAGDGPGGSIGQGFVTTLDRVFYELCPAGAAAGTCPALAAPSIVRLQCWGDPDPKSPSWPAAGSNAIPASVDVGTPPTSGGLAGKVQTSSTCVGPEVIARDVQSLTFQYFNFDGTGPIAVAATTAAGPAPPNAPALGTLNAIRRVAWRIVLQKSDNTTTVPVTFTIEGSTALQN